MALFTCSASLSAESAEPNACERQMTRAAAKHGVPLGMLYAVGLSETGRGDSLRPYALNIEGRAIYEIDKSEALVRFDEARRAGAKLIDLGCMQINHYYHAKQFQSVEEMLDPAKNVDYGARLLKELRVREGSWTMAVARYHAGPDNNAAQRKYVCRVIANLVASGFGQWTEEAQVFCKAK